MLDVLIVDDNAVEREFLRFLLQEIRYVNIVGEAGDGKQAFDLVTELNPDIIFLDINMPGVNGMEAAKQIIASGSKAYIVFVTVEDKYAAAAFELDTVDYLLKPFDYFRLGKTLTRVKQRFAAEALIIKDRKANYSVKKNTRLFFRSEGDILAVSVGDIIFVEKSPEKLTLIHTSKHVIHVNKSLAEIQKDLSGFSNFVRSHKSYLINMEKVEKLTPWGDSSYLVRFVNYTKDALISRKHSALVKDILN